MTSIPITSSNLRWLIFDFIVNFQVRYYLINNLRNLCYLVHPALGGILVLMTLERSFTITSSTGSGSLIDYQVSDNSFHYLCLNWEVHYRRLNIYFGRGNLAADRIKTMLIWWHDCWGYCFGSCKISISMHPFFARIVRQDLSDEISLHRIYHKPTLYLQFK